MSSTPVRKNTVKITCMAMIAALGIAARFLVRIPLVPNLVELTPGFLFSELSGIVGGLAGGALVGATIGLGGAMAGGEVPLMPMIGNIFLGIGTGYAIHITKNRDSLRYVLLVIMGGGLIGGFVPDMTVFLPLTESFQVALLAALADTVQGFIWAPIALLVERIVVRPLLGRYLYAYPQQLTLDNSESDENV